jgi:hypothetical protein
MKNIKLVLFSVIFLIPIICAGAETVVFCDSVPSQNGNWARNFTVPKFDPDMGTLKAVDITVDLNLSQQVEFENTGDGNSSINSTVDSALSLILPGSEEIKANTSLNFSRELAAFDGTDDFLGPSGTNLTGSSTSNTVTYSPQDVSGFVASTPEEMLLMEGVVKISPITDLSGSSSSVVRTMAGASVCVSYRYDAGAS